MVGSGGRGQGVEVALLFGLGVEGRLLMVL